MTKPDITKDTTIVHVNRNVIDANRKQGKFDPPIAVRKGKRGKAAYGDRATIYDLDGRKVGVFIYNPAGLLECGAKVALLMEKGCEVRAEGARPGE